MNTNNVRAIQKLITMFLQLNADPSDAQIHSLADALGCDKEALEATIYAMLGSTREIKQGTFARRVSATAEITDILTDSIADEEIPLDDAGTNDGLTDADIDDGMQSETEDDGVDEADVGAGQTSGDVRDVLTDDGIPVVEV